MLLPSVIITISALPFVFSSKSSSTSFTVPASFVAPGSPSIVSNLFTPAPSPSILSRQKAISTCYGNCISLTRSSSTTPLFAKKSRAGGAKGAPVLKNGKLQVKLLKYVPGTGNIGDVILVAPAFFENKLKKTNSAKIVTDEEVANEKEKLDANQKQREAAAAEMQEKLNEMKVVFEKKAGPEGHLFGGIKAKDILNELKTKFPKGSAIEGKAVKVLKMKDEEGNIVNHDIKEVGDYTVTISLMADVRADVSISVQTK